MAALFLPALAPKDKETGTACEQVTFLADDALYS
jgi:hypothetical protein